jgi:hypothetical protein
VLVAIEKAVQMSAWGTNTYRRTGQALGVGGMTVYPGPEARTGPGPEARTGPGPEARTGPGPEARTGRWVSAWWAALFGVDEKYVLVPKACGERSRTNDKPAGEMRRWSLRSALPELLRLPEYRDRS